MSSRFTPKQLLLIDQKFIPFLTRMIKRKKKEIEKKSDQYFLI